MIFWLTSSYSEPNICHLETSGSIGRVGKGGVLEDRSRRYVRNRPSYNYSYNGVEDSSHKEVIALNTSDSKCEIQLTYTYVSRVQKDTLFKKDTASDFFKEVSNYLTDDISSMP